MNDVVLGIRLTLDGKEVQGEIRGQVSELQKLGQAAQQSNQQAKSASDQFAASLKKQADTLGMTRTQTLAYEASQHNLTAAQRDQVAANIKAIESHERHEKVLGRMRVAAAAVGATLATGFVAGLRSALTAAREYEITSLRLDAALGATGHAAGIARAELDELADAMQRHTGFNDEDIRNAQAQLVMFGNVTQDVFRRGMSAVADYAAFTGTTAASAAQTIGKALQSPAEGMMMLERQIGRLTFAQDENIKTLMKQGRLLEAQHAVLDIVESRVRGTADAMNSGLNGAIKAVANNWDDLLDTMGKLAPVHNTLQGMASLLRDIRLTVEGVKNPLRDLILETASYAGYVPLVGGYIERSMRESVTRSSVTGRISNPGAEQATLAQAARIARLQAAIDAAQERSAKSAVDQAAKLEAQKNFVAALVAELGCVRQQYDVVALETGIARSVRRSAERFVSELSLREDELRRSRV